jgi:pyroglutamyl-peptidase
MLLVTGFEPFGGSADNPSAEIVSGLAPRPDLVTEVLPVAYADIDRTLADLLDRHQPSAVLLIGLAEPTTGVRLEQIALNLDDSIGADNRGEIRRRQPIDPSGPVAYRSTLPLEQLADLAADHGVAVEWSRDAGGFLCNHSFFVTRSLRPTIPAGFIHVGRDTPVDRLVPLFDAVVAELAP